MSDESVTLLVPFSGPGPVHLLREPDVPELLPDLTWCGAKRQFKHVSRPGTRDEVTCSKCLRQIKRNQPLSWGAKGSLKTEAKTGEDYSEHAMICLKPPEELRKVFADMDECTEDVDELHLTLFYLGKIGREAGDEWDKERLYRGLYQFGINAGYRGLTGKVNGFGTFCNPDENVLLALWDIPGIAEFRTHLMRYPREHGYVTRQENHGFTPHMTLAYEEDPIRTLPALPSNLPDEVHFTSVWLYWGSEETEIGLS